MVVFYILNFLNLILLEEDVYFEFMAFHVSLPILIFQRLFDSCCDHLWVINPSTVKEDVASSKYAIFFSSILKIGNRLLLICRTGDFHQLLQ